MYDIVPASSRQQVSPYSTAPQSTKALDRAQKAIMQKGSLRILEDNVDAAVTSNKMHNIASVYGEGMALAGDDPALQYLLGQQVKQYAARRA